MNFNPELSGNMPEFNLPYGYVLAILLMAMVAGGLLFFIWKKGWLSSNEMIVDEFEGLEILSLDQRPAK